MNSFFDTLNLRPQERRFIVLIAVVVFVVLNLLLVWPHFSDWGRLMLQLNRARRTIEEDNKMIAQDGGFKKELAKLQKQEGNKVLMSEQNQLQNTVRDQAVKTGVTIESYNPVPSTHGGPTNDFFEEQSLRITTQSDEAQLVDFLYQVGTDNSMIRVRDLDLKPLDVNRYRLRGTITLTANYLKKPAVSAPPPATKPAAIGPRPNPVSTGAKPSAGGKPSAAGQMPPMPTKGSTPPPRMPATQKPTPGTKHP